MENQNLGQNQGERNKGQFNPMYGKHHSPESKRKISESQLKRNKTLNQLLYKLREDNLNERIERICHNLLEQKLTARTKASMDKL